MQEEDRDAVAQSYGCPILPSLNQIIWEFLVDCRAFSESGPKPGLRAFFQVTNQMSGVQQEAAAGKVRIAADWESKAEHMLILAVSDALQPLYILQKCLTRSI